MRQGPSSFARCARALLLACGLALCATPALAQELVVDGDMEEVGTGAWQVYGAGVSLSKVADLPHAGERLLRVSASGMGVQQVALTQQGQRRGLLQLYYRVRSGSLTVRVGWGSSNRDFEGAYVVLWGAGGGWQRYERPIVTPAVPGDLRVVLTVRGEVDLDDVSLALEPAPEGEQLLADGDMEAPGVEAWRDYGATQLKEKSTAVVLGGEQSLHLRATGLGVQQTDLTRAQGQQVLVSLNLYLVSGAARVLVGWGNSNSDMDRRYDVLSQTGRWLRFERLVETPAEAGDLRLVVLLYGEAYLDDAQVGLLGAAEQPDLLQDGDMEQAHTLYWDDYGLPSGKDKTLAERSGGLRSLWVQAARSGVQQQVAGAQPGGRYALGLWYRVLTGSTRVRLGWNTSNRDLSGVDAILRPAAVWAYYQREVELPASAGGLRLVFQVDGEVYLDDLRLDPVSAYYCDGDGDQARSSSPSGTCIGAACAPAGCSLEPGDDCDDELASRGPGAAEICNQVDDDCDGAADEGEVCAPVCGPGEGDCDGVAANGCEADFATDLLHCGGCGQPCGGGETCQAGVCAPLGCPEGWGDCDGNPANGCEADLRSDPDHCGGCEVVCPAPYGACAAGERRCVTQAGGASGIYYVIYPGCDANGDGIIGRDDLAGGTPPNCDPASVNYCFDASDVCATGEEGGDYGCVAWRENCAVAELVSVCSSGGGGEPAEPLANQRTVIAGASQAGIGRLEDVPELDYVRWWDLRDWISGVHNQVLPRPGVVSVVGFWFCANSFRLDHVPGQGGPANGVLPVGQEASWGTYSTGIRDGVLELLDNGYRALLVTTNTTTLAAGYPEPIRATTQANLYAWNDWVRCLAAELALDYPGQVALFDVAALTSTDTNGTLRVEYADNDQYHLNGRAYQEALRPALEDVLASLGVYVSFPYIDPWTSGWWNQGTRFW